MRQQKDGTITAWTTINECVVSADPRHKVLIEYKGCDYRVLFYLHHLTPLSSETVHLDLLNLLPFCGDYEKRFFGILNQLEGEWSSQTYTPTNKFAEYEGLNVLEQLKRATEIIVVDSFFRLR